MVVYNARPILPRNKGDAVRRCRIHMCKTIMTSSSDYDNSDYVDNVYYTLIHSLRKSSSHYDTNIFLCSNIFLMQVLTFVICPNYKLSGLQHMHSLERQCVDIVTYAGGLCSPPTYDSACSYLGVFAKVR